MIVPVVVYFLCLVVLFHEYFLRFLEGSRGCMRFLQIEDDMLRGDSLCFSSVHIGTLFVFDKYFGILCYIEWVFMFTCKFCFLINLKTC